MNVGDIVLIEGMNYGQITAFSEFKADIVHVLCHDQYDNWAFVIKKIERSKLTFVKKSYFAFDDM